MSESLRNEGNTLFGEGLLDRALKRYRKAVDYLEYQDDMDDDQIKTANEALVKVKGNIALIQFKQKEYFDCSTTASEVLELDADNVKALVRRAQANIANGNYGDARADLKRAQKLDPENKAVPKLLKIASKKAKAEKEKERELARRMFASKPSSKKKKKKKKASSSATKTAAASSGCGDDKCCGGAAEESKSEDTKSDEAVSAPAAEATEDTGGLV